MLNYGEGIFMEWIVKEAIYGICNLERLWKCSNVERLQEPGGICFRESGVISYGLRDIFVKSCPSPAGGSLLLCYKQIDIGLF